MGTPETGKVRFAFSPATFCAFFVQILETPEIGLLCESYLGIFLCMWVFNVKRWRGKQGAHFNTRRAHFWGKLGADLDLDPNPGSREFN